MPRKLKYGQSWGRVCNKTICLPTPLLEAAEHVCRAERVSFSQFVAEAVERTLNEKCFREVLSHEPYGPAVVASSLANRVQASLDAKAAEHDHRPAPVSREEMERLWREEEARSRKAAQDALDKLAALKADPPTPGKEVHHRHPDKETWQEYEARALEEAKALSRPPAGPTEPRQSASHASPEPAVEPAPPRPEGESP